MNILFEFYRVISCSLLILFIPQKCENTICSINDKLQWKTTFYGISLTYNFITLFVFCFLYFLEIRRENILIKYLDVNPSLPYNKYYHLIKKINYYIYIISIKNMLIYLFMYI